MRRHLAGSCAAVDTDPLIARFKEASLVAEKALELRRAAEHSLNAAWAAGDAGQPSAASNARIRAVELFRTTLETEDNLEQVRQTRVRMIDLLRRAEQWDEAMALVVSVLKEGVTGILRSVLLFHITAINKRDGRCHTMRDVETW